MSEEIDSPTPHVPASHAQRHASLGIHGMHEHAAAANIHRVRRLRQTVRMAWGGLALLLLGALAVLWQRHLQAQTLETQRDESAQRFVNIVTPKPARDQAQVTLPATLVGLAETPVYAHTSGYVSHWYKDMGDEVRTGELLALVETPEVEHQLTEARAAQVQANSNYELARVAFERWKAMQERDAVPRQELDDRRGTMITARSALESTAAEVKRLEQLLAYNRIVAPFSGTVTMRNVEVGNLVDPGNGGLPKALFTMSHSDVLRTLVQVPEAYAPRVQNGQTAQISLLELPGQVFKATVTRTSRAIDTTSRTLEVELRIPNSDHALLPGSYAQVTMNLGGAGAGAARIRGNDVFVLPNNSLLFRPEGSLVAVVDKDGRTQLRPVKVGRDFGVQVEILDGVSATDAVIVNPPDSIADGETVKATPLPEAPVKGQEKH